MKLTSLVCLVLVFVRPHVAGGQSVADGKNEVLAEAKEMETRERSPGQPIFQSHCAVCHEKAETGAPGLAALQYLTAATIFDTLTAGRMRAQARMLSDQERHQVAEYLSLQLPASSGTHALKNCAQDPDWFDPRKESVGAGWGITAENTRLIPARQAKLKAADLSRLKLQWAFAFPNASAAVAQPLVAGGGLFVGSQDGTIYALDARSGCAHWAYKASADILGGLTLHHSGVADSSLFVADRLAYVYAIDPRTGKLRWRVRADNHPSATIMGTPVVLGDRVFVPITSFEETAAQPNYSCCTFRGSIVALVASSGQLLWRSYAIPQPATEQSKNALGVSQFAPSGAGIWSAPTIDVRRGLIYFATGNSYSEPADENSDAIVAIDLKTGARRWRTQTMADDTWTIWEYLCQTDPEKKSTSGCPSLKKPGPDIDMSTSPVLVHGPAGKDILIVGRKDGMTFGVNPDTGKIEWTARNSDSTDPNAASLNFGIMAEGGEIFVPSIGTYFPNGGTFTAKPDDGLHAFDALTGTRLWTARVSDDCDRSAPCTGLSFAPIGFPGVVFAGATDGYVRAYDTATGKVLWHFDTARDFKTLSGDVAHGGSIGRNSIMIGNGMVFVGSGYSKFPGNVLLAFSP